MTGETSNRNAFPRELLLDDGPGPAAHITRGKADALIASALAEAGFGELPAEQTPAEVATPAAPVQAPAPRRRWAMWQVAAATLLAFAGIGSASAAIMIWQKRVREPEPVVTSLSPPKKAAKKPAKEEEVVVEELPREPIVLDEFTIESSKKKVPVRAPEDWLEEANRLRAAGSWSDADETYARVWQTAPQSSAAYVARVASASVRLDHLHDAKGALARYRAALEQSPRGSLTEEIRYGIAEAYRALGDTAREKKALEEFLHEHPGAGLARKAKARLAQLDGAP